MTNYLPLVLFTLLALLHGCAPPQETKAIDVMTWNIWHGGLHGHASTDFQEDTANTNNVLKVLLEESPDVLLMQETYCCGMDIAREAGYVYSVRGSANLSIHSKYPIVDTIALFKPFNSHGAIIEIEGTSMLFVNVWLHYLPDYFQDIKTLSPDSLIQKEGTTRLKEITAIITALDSLQRAHHLPVVVGGDFNSGSHLDWIAATRRYHYDKVVEWPVSKVMHDHGFVDSFREANPDPLETLEGTWGYLNEDIISDRIDFIYYQGNGMYCPASKIVMDDPEGGFFNSDHRAILSTIRF